MHITRNLANHQRLVRSWILRKPTTDTLLNQRNSILNNPQMNVALMPHQRNVSMQEGTREEHNGSKHKEQVIWGAQHQLIHL